MWMDMGVSKNMGENLKSSILIGVFWGVSHYFWKHPYVSGKILTTFPPVGRPKRWALVGGIPPKKPGISRLRIYIKLPRWICMDMYDLLTPTNRCWK